MPYVRSKIQICMGNTTGWLKSNTLTTQMMLHIINIMSVFTLEIKTNATNNFSLLSVPGWAALRFSGKQTYHIKLS